MAQPAHAPGDDRSDREPEMGDAAGGGARPDVRLRLVVDTALEEARDEFFQNADRHGPRLPDIIRRSAIASAVLPMVLSVATFTPVRAWLSGELSPRAADLALIAPSLAALLVAAAMLAPLARVSVTPLLVAATCLLVPAVWLTSTGAFIAAMLPLALAGLLIGLAGARTMRRAVWALPVLLAAGISDAQSVRGGVTHDLLGAVDGGPTSHTFTTAITSVDPGLVTGIDYLLLHLPVLSGMWVLGFVDVVAVGLLLGLTHLFWLPVGRTSVAIGLALVLTAGIGGPVPVLPALGAAWLLANARLVWRATRFSMRRLMYLGG